MRPYGFDGLRTRRVTVVNLIKPSADSGWWWNYALDDVTNSNEFTSLFKEWKLERVDVGFVWSPPNNTANHSAPPRIYFLADPVAAAAPSSLDVLVQQGAKEFAFNETRNTFRVTFQPKVTQLVSSAPGSGSTVNNALMPHNTWLSTAQPSTGYGALVAWIGGWSTATANSGEIRMTTTYHFAFRGVQ